MTISASGSVISPAAEAPPAADPPRGHDTGGDGLCFLLASGGELSTVFFETAEDDEGVVVVMDWSRMPESNEGGEAWEASLLQN